MGAGLAPRKGRRWRPSIKDFGIHIMENNNSIIVLSRTGNNHVAPSRSEEGGWLSDQLTALGERASIKKIAACEFNKSTAILGGKNIKGRKGKEESTYRGVDTTSRPEL